MPIAYPVIYKRNLAGKVTSLYFPDLAFEVELSSEAAEPENLEQYAREILLQRLNLLKDQNAAISYPKKLTSYKHLIENSPHFLTKIKVDVAFKTGFFEKFLPKFGLFSAVITSLTMAFIYLTAILITSGTSASSLTLTIIGVLSTATMAVIVYNYSDASKMSGQLGKVLDDTRTHLTNCRPMASHMLAQLTLDKHSTAKMLTKLVTTAIPIIASSFSSVGHYREVKAMGEKISDDQDVFKESYFVVNNVMILFSMYSLLTFQISFLPHVFKFLDQVFEPVAKKPHTAAYALLHEEQELQPTPEDENLNLLIENEVPREEQASSSLRHP